MRVVTAPTIVGLDAMAPTPRASWSRLLTGGRVLRGRRAAVLHMALPADDRVEQVTRRVERWPVRFPPLPRARRRRRSAGEVSLGVERYGATGSGHARRTRGFVRDSDRRLGSHRELAHTGCPIAAAARDEVVNELHARRGDLQVGAQEVAELVEAVDAAVGEVEELHELLVAAALPEARQELGEAPRRRRCLPREVADLYQDRVGVDDRLSALLRGLAQGDERRRRGLRERAEGLRGAGDTGGGVREVGEGGARLVGEALELHHLATQRFEGGRELLEPGLEVRAALGGCLAGGVGVPDEAGHLLALPGQRCQHAVGVGGEL